MGYNQSDFAALAGAKKHSQINYEADKTSPTCEYLSVLGEQGAADKLPARLRERLATAIEAVEEGLEAIDRTASPRVKAELVLAAYDILASQGESASAEIIRLIRA